MKTVILDGYWKKVFEEENNSPVPIEVTRSYSTGMKTSNTEEKTVTNTHTAGIELKGEVGTVAVLSVGLSYQFQRETQTKTTSGSEMHKSEEQTVKFTVPGWTRLVRWQFVVEFADDFAYEYDWTVTATNSTEMPIAINTTATVRLTKQIHFGSTPIRIKHKSSGRYMIIVTRKRWPAATLGSSKSFHYILYDTGSRGIRIRALQSTISWKDYLYAAIDGGVYFDVSWESDRRASMEKQHWYLNKGPLLYDGDVVTFRNNNYDNDYICSNCGGKSKVEIYHKKKSEEEWILEVVSP